MLLTITGVVVALFGIWVLTVGTSKTVQALHAARHSVTVLMGAIGLEALGIMFVILGAAMMLRNHL